MLRIMLVISVIWSLVVAWPAFGAPYLVCDPQAGVSAYQISGAAWIPAAVPAQPDGSLKLDVAASTLGSTSLQVKACNAWGECSTATPFVLQRPAVPSAAAGLKLTP